MIPVHAEFQEPLQEVDSGYGTEQQICAVGDGSFASVRGTMSWIIPSLPVLYPKGPFHLLHPCTLPQLQSKSSTLQIVPGPKEAAGQRWPL